jgi:hypothetical protein
VGSGRARGRQHQIEKRVRATQGRNARTVNATPSRQARCCTFIGSGESSIRLDPCAPDSTAAVFPCDIF